MTSPSFRRLRHFISRNKLRILLKVLFVNFNKSSIFWYFSAAVNYVADFFSSGLRISGLPDWILFNQDLRILP
jgi:hypothetical protein